MGYSYMEQEPAQLLILTSLLCVCFHFSTVSAEILKSSLTNMERHIQRLENDIENFPKTADEQDKFVEKMSISFFYCVHSKTIHRFGRKFAP